MTGEMGSVSELSHLYIILYNIMLIYIYIYLLLILYSLVSLYRQTTLWKYTKRHVFGLKLFKSYWSTTHIHFFLPPIHHFSLVKSCEIHHSLGSQNATTSHVTSCHLYRLFGWPTQDQERWPSELTSWVCSLRFLKVLFQLLAHSVYIIWYSYIIYDIIIVLCVIYYIIIYYILYILDII